MKTILVTGGIASGKSEVCRYLASKGLPVYDSDSRTKALYGSVPGLVERIEAAIGVPFAQIGVIFSTARGARRWKPSFIRRLSAISKPGAPNRKAPRRFFSNRRLPRKSPSCVASTTASCSSTRRSKND